MSASEFGTEDALGDRVREGEETMVGDRWEGITESSTGTTIWGALRGGLTSIGEEKEGLRGGL